jgi:hypothetical protein
VASLPRIGELLVEAGAITREQLSQALSAQREHGGRLGTNLVELGFIDERGLAGVLARQLNIPSATAAQLERAEADALKLLPAKSAAKLRAIPLREDKGKLWVALADPTDPAVLDELAKGTGKPVRPMVAPEMLLQEALERHYHIKRKARVVVRSGGSDLLRLDHTPSRPIDLGLPTIAPPPSRGRPPPPPIDAPVYNTFPAAPRERDLEKLAGYLDDSGARPKRAVVRMLMRDAAQQLASANSDDAILDVALRYLSQDAPRLAALTARNGMLCGWRGLAIDPAVVRAVNAPMDSAPGLARMLASGESWIGELDGDTLGAQLARQLDARLRAITLLVPVRIGKRPVGAIVGLDCDADALKQRIDFDRLAGKLDQALHINYLRRLLLQD